MKGYVIQVGAHSPQKVLVGHLDPKTGQPTGDVFETFKQVGTFNIINSARVWARRVMADGTLPGDSPLEVNNVKYTGRLEFLRWGDQKPGAQAIQVRFLPMSSSLDFAYQQTIQKIDTKVEDGHDYIYLTPGENKFDEDKDKNLVQMLKVHPQNRESVSKNPDPQIKGYTYYEVTEQNSDRSFVEKKEKELDAGLFIKGLSSDEKSLKNLLAVLIGYGVDFGEVNLLSNPTAIYTALLGKANVDPDTVLKNIDRYKADLLDLFEKAKSFKALDLTKDGHIGCADSKGKQNAVFTGLEAKGKEMVDYVINNFVRDDIFTQTKFFKSLCDELK